MRVVLAAAAALAVAAGPVAAALAVYTTADSVTVKAAQPGEAVGRALGYRISHWPEGELLAEGEALPEPDDLGRQQFRVGGLKPKLWWPNDPQLYTLTLSSGGSVIGSFRIGFRTFETKDRKFYLNGHPIYLRGMPINPPDRDEPPSVNQDPDYIRGYLRLLKSANVNLIRTSGKAWLDACDEVGMMIFQGNYAGAPGGTGGPETPVDVPPPLDVTLPAYRRIVSELSPHPSVVIYVLTNEVDSLSTFAKGRYLPVLEQVCEDVKKLDPTRPIIGNAGFGRGRPGDIYDIHKYSGWYHGSASDWYDLREFRDEAKRLGQPLSVSECVAAYTSDEGVFETMSKQMATMVRWAACEPDQKAAALGYQAELVGQIIEITRRMRTAGDPGVAAMMPFTYLLGWTKALRAEEIVTKPAFEQLRKSFAPVLLSAECWQSSVVPGGRISFRLHVINDADDGSDLEGAEIEIAGGSAGETRRIKVPKVSYYSNWSTGVMVKAPDSATRAEHQVICRLRSGGKVLSESIVRVSVRPMPDALDTRAFVYDPSGKTAAALEKLGLGTTSIQDLAKLPERGLVIIGEVAFADGRYPAKGQVERLLASGGTLLVLKQKPTGWRADWLGVDLLLGSRRPFTYVQQMTGDSALWGDISARDLRFWNHAGWTKALNRPGSSPADTVPDVCPVRDLYSCDRLEDLARMREWAASDKMLHGWALVEICGTRGAGRVILSQFECLKRAAHDPVAATLLANLVRYAGRPEAAQPPDLTGVVKWDLDLLRKGALVSRSQGLIPHSPVYSHFGPSKGRLADDHKIDGTMLIGDYTITSNGWVRPYFSSSRGASGTVFGTLSKPCSSLRLMVSNPSSKIAKVRLLLDGEPRHGERELPPGEGELEWTFPERPIGPIRLELACDEQIIIRESRFE